MSHRRTALRPPCHDTSSYAWQEMAENIMTVGPGYRDGEHPQVHPKLPLHRPWISTAEGPLGHQTHFRNEPITEDNLVYEGVTAEYGLVYANQYRTF